MKKKQNRSSYNIISYNFNVNLAQYNLLREYSRFKKIGARASISFIKSCCSPVIGDFMFAADKLNIQLSFSQNALVTFSVTDPLTTQRSAHRRRALSGLTSAPTLNPFKALLTRQKRKMSRIARHTIYISQLIIVILCWSYAFIFFKNFDKKVQQSWSSNSFLSIIGDVLFLPIIKD